MGGSSTWLGVPAQQVSCDGRQHAEAEVLHRLLHPDTVDVQWLSKDCTSPDG